MLIRNNDACHRCKVQLKDGGGCQEMSGIVGFNESIKY